MNQQPPVTPERIMQFMWGYAPTLILQTALEYRLFDLIDEKPRTATELANLTQTSPRGMVAVLNALVGFQFLAKSGEGYTLTPESAAFLVSTKPGFHGHLFYHSAKQLLPTWMHLTETVKTGKPPTHVNKREEGAEFFAQFVESLFPLSYTASQKLGEHLEIAKTAAPLSVLDIGAGSGVWGIALAQQSKHVTIRAVDWPQVLLVTQKVATKHGVGDRLATAPGDLLEADFGKGHAVATIGHILHSEGVERSKQLLKRVFAALAPGGTVAIMEFLPNDERTGPPPALIFAVNMLVNTDQGDTFTFPEISGWLKEAGFVNPRLLPVPAVSPLILATKP